MMTLFLGRAHAASASRGKLWIAMSLIGRCALCKIWVQLQFECNYKHNCTLSLWHVTIAFALLPSLLALRRCLPPWSQWLWRLHVLQMGTRPRAKREWPLPDFCVQCTHRLHMMLDTCVHKYIIPPIKVQWNRYIILFLKWEYQDMSVPLESVVLTTSWWVGANSSSCNYSCTQNNQSPGFNTDL